MRASWRIGRIAGIDLRLHFTFPILLAWVGVAGFGSGGAPVAVQSVAVIMLLFAIVVLHELGHALAARAYGIGTREILLLPIGGVAQLERIPERPRQEPVIALAGPAVNFLLACPALIAVGPGGVAALATQPLHPAEAALASLLLTNVVMFVFNMLPAFPMDGGRVLRALLAMRMEYVRATRIAARIGQLLAVALGVLGLAMNPMWVVAALFVFTGAGAELRMVELRHAAHHLKVRAVMSPTPWRVGSHVPLGAAVRLALGGGPRVLPVVDDGRLVGAAVRDELLAALTELGSDVPIREVMRTAVATANPDEPLLDAMERAMVSGLPGLLVVHDGQLLGQVDLGRLVELLPGLAPRLASAPDGVVAPVSGPCAVGNGA